MTNTNTTAKTDTAAAVEATVSAGIEDYQPKVGNPVKSEDTYSVTLCDSLGYALRTPVRHGDNRCQSIISALSVMPESIDDMRVKDYVALISAYVHDRLPGCVFRFEITPDASVTFGCAHWIITPVLESSFDGFFCDNEELTCALHGIYFFGRAMLVGGGETSNSYFRRMCIDLPVVTKSYAKAHPELVGM